MSRYLVTAAAVVVKVSDQRRQVYVYRGATLPPSISEGEAERLLRRGMIVEHRPEPPSRAPEQPSGDVESDLTDLTAADLRKLADERGVTVPKSASKAVLIEALKAPAAEGVVVEPEVADLLAQAAARGIEVPEGVTDPADLVALLSQ